MSLACVAATIIVLYCHPLLGDGATPSRDGDGGQQDGGHKDDGDQPASPPMRLGLKLRMVRASCLITGPTPFFCTHPCTLAHQDTSYGQDKAVLTKLLQEHGVAVRGGIGGAMQLLDILMARGGNQLVSCITITIHFAITIHYIHASPHLAIFSMQEWKRMPPPPGDSDFSLLPNEEGHGTGPDEYMAEVEAHWQTRKLEWLKRPEYKDMQPETV